MMANPSPAPTPVAPSPREMTLSELISELSDIRILLEARRPEPTPRRAERPS